MVGQAFSLSYLSPKPSSFFLSASSATSAQRRIVSQAMKNIFLHWSPTDQMFSDNAVEQRIINMVVPNAVGIDNQERAVITDAQARRQTPLNADGIIVAAKFTQFIGQALIEFGSLLF